MIDQAAIALRFALYADLLVFSGLAAFLIYGTASSAGRLEATQRKWFGAAAALGLLLSALGVVITAGSMAGVPVAQIDPPSIWFVLGGTSFGTAACVRFAALTVVMLAVLLVRRATSLGVIAIAGGAAVATLAWNGHGAMDDGSAGWVPLVADVLHLWAAGLWVGAVLGLILLLFRPLEKLTLADLSQTQSALAKFSLVGSLLVAVIVGTGVVNTLFLVGLSNLTALWTTRYGWLLVAKLALFGAMLGLAASNRFLLTPSLAREIDRGRPQAAIKRLRLSLVLELSAAISIFGLVAWLGTLEPPISAAQ